MKQCSFGPRKPGTEAHIKCRDYIKSELEKYCENVKLQPFEHKWTRTNEVVKMWNIIGEQDYRTAKTKVVLLAHWDTRPLATEETDPEKRLKPILGANDGASGVAVLLELARVLKASNPEVGIMYVFTDGEDLGPDIEEMFLGAEYWAKNLPTPKPNYGILLDMIGDKNLQIPLEPNSVQYARSLAREFYRHASHIGLGTTFPQEFGPDIMDDHLCINKAGIPTMDLIDFTYPSWHTLADTPDKCSAASLGKVGKMLQSWLLKTPVFKITND